MGSIAVLVSSTTIGLTMMRCRSHVKKDGSVDARRLTADLTETSSTLSTVEQIEETAAVEFVFVVFVFGGSVLLDRSNWRRSMAWILLVLLIPT